jgi:hypothetical protein
LSFAASVFVVSPQPMSQFPHDEFAKGLLESLLAPFGKVEAAYTLSSETREIDVYFQPDVVPTNLGLLSKFAATTAAFEAFRNAVDLVEIRTSCLAKLYFLHGQIIREAKKQDVDVSENDLPMLWILTPTLAAPKLKGFAAVPKLKQWGKGVYLAPEHYKMGIVVIHQLPVAAETMWLRLLGRDKVQAQAIDEVARLPVDSPERINALELFSNLKSNLEANQPVDQEEEDLVLRLSPIYLEQIQEAEQRGESRLIIKQLQRRFGVLSADVKEKISALPVDQIEVLGEDIFDFSDAEELVTWLNINS